MLSDGEILKLIEDGVLEGADGGRVGPVSYDLRNHKFYSEGQELDSVTLGPGESAFVGTVEAVKLPNDVSAQVRLKNSRIRQGLSIEAPVYFPGHWTRLFYRVTNVTGDEITLDVNHEIAQVFFEKLSQPVHAEYSGTFSDEFDFRGVGSYKDVYGAETRRIAKESENIENAEQRIYGNVIAIMGVFVAIFSLVNVDMAWVSSKMAVSSLVVLDLSIVGGMAALVGLVSSILGSKRANKALPWVVAAISFVVAALLVLLVR